MIIELLCAKKAIVDKQTPIQEKQISQCKTLKKYFIWHCIFELKES